MLFGPMRIKKQGWNETSRVFIRHARKFKITRSNSHSLSRSLCSLICIQTIRKQWQRESGKEFWFVNKTSFWPRVPKNPALHCSEPAQAEQKNDIFFSDWVVIGYFTRVIAICFPPIIQQKDPKITGALEPMDIWSLAQKLVWNTLFLPLLHKIVSFLKKSLNL